MCDIVSGLSGLGLRPVIGVRHLLTISVAHGSLRDGELAEMKPPPYSLSGSLSLLSSPLWFCFVWLHAFFCLHVTTLHTTQHSTAQENGSEFYQNCPTEVVSLLLIIWYHPLYGICGCQCFCFCSQPKSL